MSINAQGGAIEVALQYAKFREGYTEPFKATGYATFVSNPQANDTLVVNGTTYTFKASLSSANDILIGTTARDTATNFVNALIGGGTRGTDYHADTALSLKMDPELAASMDRVYFTAWIFGTAGNSLTLSTSSSGRITVSGSTLTGGVDGGEARAAKGRIGFVANPTAADTITIGSVTYKFESTMASAEDVKLGADLATTLTHLLKTINGTGVAGTDYYTGSTSPNTDVSAAVNDEDSIMTLTALAEGSADNSTDLAKSGTDISVTGTDLAGGADAELFSRSSLSWKRFRATDIDYGAQQQQDTFPLETGGPLTPTGAYKGLVFAGGGFTFLPRFYDDLGVLLLAAMGNASFSDQTTYGIHTFRFATNEGDLPWVAVRKAIPGRGNVKGQGLVVFDNVVGNLRLTVAPTQPIQARVDFMGRYPELDNHPEAWDSSTEDYESVGMACKGSFKLPTVFGDNVVPTTSLQIDLSNSVTGPRQEAIVGSFYLDDVIALTRALTIRFVHKWDSPEVYQRSFGGSGETAWSPTPFVTETDGSDYAFDLLIQAPFNITGTNVPYSLRIRANQAFWQPEGDPRLQPGNLVMQPWSATVLYDSSFYAEFVLTNGRTTAYSVPSEP